MTTTKTHDAAAEAAKLQARAEQMKADRARRIAEINARMDAEKAAAPKPAKKWW